MAQAWLVSGIFRAINAASVCDTTMGVRKDSIDETKVIISDACVCCYDGCMFSDCPIGCAGSETCCCLEGEFCCKPGADMLCLGCCACRCIAPSTCMKAENQCCCEVVGIAIPCDDEVPCMLACCFLDCYPKCGCCQAMGELMSAKTDG